MIRRVALITATVALFIALTVGNDAHGYITAKNNMMPKDRRALAMVYRQHWEKTCSQIPALTPREEDYLKREYDNLLNPDRSISGDVYKRTSRAEGSIPFAIREANKTCEQINRKLDFVILEHRQFRQARWRAWLLIAWDYARPEFLRYYKTLKLENVISDFDCDNHEGETDIKDIDICEHIFQQQSRDILYYFILPLLPE